MSTSIEPQAPSPAVLDAPAEALAVVPAPARAPEDDREALPEVTREAPQEAAREPGREPGQEPGPEPAAPEPARAEVPAPRTAPTRRGGRVGLNHQAVVAEAARLADETGDARVPLATVADRLGVRLPSLYKHVAGVDGMRRGLARLATEGLRDALTRAAAGPSASGIARLATAYREWAGEHPGLHTALLDRPHPDDPEHVAAAAAVGEVFLAAAGTHGVEGHEALVDAARVLRGTLHGFCALELAGCLGGRDGVDRSFARVVAALEAALTTARPAPPAPATTPAP